MVFFHEFDDKVRFLVIYQDVSKKPSVIEKHTKINIRTIQRWIKETEENINILERREGQGRKPTIPEIVRSNVVWTTRRNPQRSSTRSLSKQYNIGKSTVGRVLAEKNYKYKKVKAKKVLTSEEKEDSRIL